MEYFAMIGRIHYNILDPFPNGDPAKSRASLEDIWKNHAGRVLFKSAPAEDPTE